MLWLVSVSTSQLLVLALPPVQPVYRTVCASISVFIKISRKWKRLSADTSGKKCRVCKLDTCVTKIEIIRITKVLESRASVSPYIYTMLVDFVVF